MEKVPTFKTCIPPLYNIDFLFPTPFLPNQTKNVSLHKQAQTIHQIFRFPDENSEESTLN